MNTFSFTTLTLCGLGYIGLPTAALFACHGKQVLGVDINPRIVDTINAGHIHIIEPDLAEKVQSVVSSGSLRAAHVIEPSDIFIIAVPTPFQDGHKPDLHCIDEVCRNIAPTLRAGSLVILESTSPIGTTERVASQLADFRPDLTFPQQIGEAADIQIAYCPERVLPGNIIQELISNDRIIGGMSRRAAEMAKAVYQTFVRGECLLTNVRTAEMCKLTENSFRDVNIAFANELSLLCDRFGINVRELIQLANRHPRVNILQPGAGVGGHCIAVDPWFLIDGAPDLARLVRTSREVNDAKPQWVVEKILEAVRNQEQTQSKCSAMPKTVACLGLAFKPDVDDLRESPAVEIVRQIVSSGYRVMAVEPHITTLPTELNNTFITLSTLEDALNQADVIAILVKHSLFQHAKRQIHACQPLVDAVGLDG